MNISKIKQKFQQKGLPIKSFKKKTDYQILKAGR